MSVLVFRYIYIRIVCVCRYEQVITNLFIVYNYIFYSSLLIVYEGDNDHYSNRFDNIEPFETPDLEFNKQQHFGEQIHFANNAVSPGIRVPKKRPVSSSSQE